MSHFIYFKIIENPQALLSPHAVNLARLEAEVAINSILPIRVHLVPDEQITVLDDKTIVDSIVAGSIGSKSQHNDIQEHLKDYLKRWHTYKDKFTSLEWYHVMLDFYEFLEKKGRIK